MGGVQIASNLLMFMGRKEWGAVSWKSVGHQGALKKETMAKEMAGLCTHFVSENNAFCERGL